MPDAPEPYAYVFLHGPRDGEVTDDLSVLDTAPGPAGQYGPSGRAIVTAPGERRHALQWYPAPGGHRNPPRCVEACSAGCPAVGLAGA